MNVVFFSGFHVNLIPRGTQSSPSDDQISVFFFIDLHFDILNNYSSFCIDDNENKQLVNDSMLTVTDNGRAQFVGIDIDTFAIRPASSSSASMYVKSFVENIFLYFSLFQISSTYAISFNIIIISTNIS